MSVSLPLPLHLPISLNTRNIQDKVRREIDAILQGSDPSSHADLEKKLPYMEMVLKESARMHPALALSLPEKNCQTSY